MSDTTGPYPVNSNAHRVASAAREYGWQVVVEPDGALRMSLLDWTVHAVFSPDGRFTTARADGPGSDCLALGMVEVLDVLEEYGSPSAPQ
ncbi:MULTISPECIES: hypothetical protein [Kitasatospora]|uniref:Uncharacterized protein n=1 Tax=Kitasatospora cystarginea TaxID=58350 RepID=A0ABP5RZ81_9ACTN